MGYYENLGYNFILQRAVNGAKYLRMDQVTFVEDSFERVWFFQKIGVMLCAVWYYLYNLKNLKNVHDESYF